MNKLFLDGHKLIYHLPVVEKWLEGKDISPIHAEISPTAACNQRCFFCYRDFSGHKPDFLKEDIYLKLIRSLAKVGLKSVLLAGDGEPLLNKITPAAIELGKKLNIDMALNSNGFLLTERVAGEILDKLTWLRFSIMAATPQLYARIHGAKPGDFETVIQNIERAVQMKKKSKAKVTLGIQQVLLKESAHEVAELAKIAKEIGVDYYVLKPFSKHPQNVYDVPDDLHIKFEKELREAEKYQDENFSVIIRWNTFVDKGERNYQRCLGLPFITQIGADGGVYSCCPFFGKKDFLYGNLNEEDFEDILKGNRRKEVLRHVFDNIDVHKDCMTYCRHHQINKFLWDITHPPAHENFI